MKEYKNNEMANLNEQMDIISVGIEESLLRTTNLNCLSLSRIINLFVLNLVTTK